MKKNSKTKLTIKTCQKRFIKCKKVYLFIENSKVGSKKSSKLVYIVLITIYYYLLLKLSVMYCRGKCPHFSTIENLPFFPIY